MTNRVGFFDPAARALTTFDSTATVEGWFDDTNIPDGAASHDVTLQLTGQSVTASAGTLGVSTALVVAGQSSSTNQGTITPVIGGGDVTVAITGIAVATSQGTLGVKFDLAVPGQSAATAQGTITATIGGDITVQLVGQQVTTSQGSFSVKSDLPVTGYSVAAQQGTVTPVITGGGDVTIELVGQSVGASVGTIGIGHLLELNGESITVDQGTISVSGIPVWPAPAQVLLGIVYGPTGVEYTGTLTSTGQGESIIAIRSFAGRF